jgi:hypothetical protein
MSWSVCASLITIALLVLRSGYAGDKCPRAVVDGLYKVCGHSLAVNTFDTAQCSLESRGEARGMLADDG